MGGVNVGAIGEGSGEDEDDRYGCRCFLREERVPCLCFNIDFLLLFIIVCKSIEY